MREVVSLKPEVILKISGGTSHLELYQDYLTIKPSNVQRLSGSAKTIPISAIITVSIEKPFLATPYLQVVTAGMVPKKGDNLKGASANVVLIMPGNMSKAKKLQEYVASYQAKTSAPPASSYTDLEKLAELRDKGIITQEEFEAKKKSLLNI